MVLYATTRRDRTELFKSSTVAKSARIGFREEVQAGADWIDNISGETVSVTSFDGLRLSAKLISPASPVAAVVALHGFRSWPSREFAGVGKLLYENKIAVLYPYQRSHRLSEGKFITFGVNEKKDCALWAQELSARFPQLPIYLYGQSMGGTTVLMAGSEELPSNVYGIIADSAYHSPADVIGSLLIRSYHIPQYPLLFFIDFWTVLLGHYELFKNTASKGMRNKYAYLFFHGEKDVLVPYEMGLKNYLLCPSKQKRWLRFSEAGHCACCYTGKEEYQSALLAFINNTINMEENKK